MSGEDLASIGIKADSTQVVSASRDLADLGAVGARTETQINSLGTATERFAAQMRAAGVADADIIKQLTAHGHAAEGVATVTQVLANAQNEATASTLRFTSSFTGLNTALGITDVEFKSAAASAAVFGRSLAGLSALDAATVQTTGLSKEMLALKAAQDGMNWAKTTEGLLGIDAATKSAQESASVFAAEQIANAEKVGMAVAMMEAEQVSAAEAASAANLQLLKSLTGLSEAQLMAAATAGVQATATGAAATAALGDAAAQEVAAARIGGSSIKVRESFVLMREAARGDFTRMAGSATILAQAFGLLEAAFLPLIVAGVVLGGTLEIVKNQINSGVNGTGDLTRGLGLTEQQLERVKNRYVSMWDTIKAIGQTLWHDSGVDTLGSVWQQTWDFIAKVTTDIFAGIVGSVIGGVRVIEEAWKAMPTALGGAGSTAGIDFAKAFQSGVDDAKKALDKFYSDVAAKARENAISRIKDEAGKAPKDSTGEQVDKQIMALKDEAAFQEKVNKAVEDGSKSVGAAAQELRNYNSVASVKARLMESSLYGDKETNQLTDAGTQKLEAYTAALKKRNDAERDFNFLKDAEKAQQSLNVLALEGSMIGHNEAETRIAVATQKAYWDAVNKGYDASQITQYVKDQGDVARATENNKAMTEALDSDLQAQIDQFKLLSDEADKMASSMSSSFGRVGDAVGGMTVALVKYQEQQQTFTKRQAEIDRMDQDALTTKNAQVLLTKQQQAANDNLITGELDGLKSLFGQKTGMYQALTTIESAYNAMVLANNLVQIASNIPLMISNVATGASKMFADLGPVGFVAVAAMVGVMAALGFSGGGGGTAAPPVDIAKNQQAAQGAGSVLGDAKAKSDSIAQSLDQLSKNTNADLEYSNQMVTSLKSIDAKIGSLTALLAKQLQVGGLFDTASLGLGTNGGGGGILGSLFGSSKTTSTLLDQGISVASTSIGQALANGIAASAYQTVQNTKTSSALFGLISSTKTTDATTNTPLSSDFTSQIQSIVGNLRSTVLDAATKLGVQGAQQIVDSMSLSIGKISFKDMTGDQIQSALNAVFSKLGDDMVSAAIPEVAALEQVGEGALQTLARLVTQYTAVDDAVKTVGFIFSQTGIQSLAARDALVQASGGLDKFTSQANFFVQNFLTGAQALLPVQKAVNDEMARLGYVGITSKNQFTQIVQGIDASTASGAALYSALMNVAPAFAKVADAATALMSKQRDLQIQLLTDQGNVIGATTLQRRKEIEALDASLVPMQQTIYATEDLKAANDNLSTAQQNLIGEYNTTKTALDNQTKTLLSLQSAATNANQKVSDAQKALAALTTTTVDFASAAAAAHQDLTDAYNAEQSALQATIDTFGGFVSSLADARKQLDSSEFTTNARTRAALTQGTYESTLAAAQSGDQTATANLPQAGQDYLTALKAVSGNSQQFNAAVATVRQGLAIAQSSAQKQVDTATLQLNSLKEAVKGLGLIQEAVTVVGENLYSVHGSIVSLSTLIARDAAAQAAATEDAAATQAAAIQAANDNLSKAIADSDNANLAVAKQQLLVNQAQADFDHATQAITDAGLLSVVTATQSVGDKIDQLLSAVVAASAAEQAAQALLLATQVSMKATQEVSAVQIVQTAKAIQAVSNDNGEGAYNAAQATVDALRAQRDAAVSAIGVTQTAPFANENQASNTLGGYSYFNYNPNSPASVAALAAAQAANQAYMDAFSQAHILYAAIPGHASGLKRVPYDNYVARLHADEMVLNQAEANNYRSGGSNDNSAEIRGLRKDMERLYKSMDMMHANAKETKDILKRVTKGGDAMRTTAVS